MDNSFTKPSLIAMVALAAFLQCVACTQPAIRSQASNRPADQVNEQSKPVTPRDILANQPNFRADEIFSEYEPRVHGGFSDASKIAKKGNCYRSEFESYAFYFKPNQPTVKCHIKGRTCSEVPSSDDRRWYRNINHAEIFADEGDIIFETVGTENVQGHECIKIKATKKGESSQNGKEETAFLYAAKDLKNLVIAIEVNLWDRTDSYVLKNISFDVPDELFAPLENYKPSRV